MNRLILASFFLVLGCGTFSDPSQDVLDEVKASVKSCWRKLLKESGQIMEMREEMKSMPERSWLPFTTDKRDQQARIRERLRDMRGLLLSTDSQRLLEEVDEIDQDIADLDEDIRATAELRTLNPDEAQKHEAKLEKLRSQKVVLEARRKARASRVCSDLRALGLNIGGEAAENCLFTVNFGELIDGVVVSRNIATVVENLRELMASGDVVASKRYYGLYLAMVDVQIVCFEDYLEKSRKGPWRGGINRIRDQALAVRDTALERSRDASLETAQRTIFAHNAKVNGATIQAAEAYLSVLDAHEKVIDRKLAAARKVKAVVENSYDTVSLAGEFLTLAKSNQNAFDSLLTLELPPIQMFNDATVQAEFLAITKKLKE